jgi:hypothetical protein
MEERGWRDKEKNRGHKNALMSRTKAKTFCFEFETENGNIKTGKRGKSSIEVGFCKSLHHATDRSV